MNRKQRIEIIILKNFPEWKINIEDNSIDHAGHNNFDGNQETHFKLSLKPPIDMQQTKLSIHRKINDLLKAEFSNGLHSLEIIIIN